MLTEARYTDKHMDKTMNLVLRNCAVVFVKAKTSYDPNKDLMDRLRKSQEASMESKPKRLQEVKEARIDETVVAESDVKTSSAIMETDYAVYEPDSKPVKVAQEKQDPLEHFEGDDELVSEFSLEKTPEETEISQIELISESQISTVNIASESGIMEIPQGFEAQKFDNKVFQEKPIDVERNGVELPDLQNSSSESDSSANNADDEIEFSIDCSGDLDIDNCEPKPDTAKLLQSEYMNRVLRRHELGSDVLRLNEGTIIEPYLTVGKTMLKTSCDDEGSLTVSLPSFKGDKSGFVSLRASKSKHDPFNTASKASELSSTAFEDSLHSDMEAAFEDYMAQLMLANDEDSDDSESEELKASSAGNISDCIASGDRNEESCENFRRQYQAVSEDFSEESSDGEEIMDPLDHLEEFNGLDLDFDSDKEGLEEILAFAKQQKRLSQLDLEANTASQKVGKVRRQRLELGSEIELELRDSLMEQFQYQKRARRLKKIRKKEKKLHEDVGNLYLKEKFEYSLHIKEIKQTIEEFLHDANRETLSFPPLLGRGHKTLHKLANYYNMKIIRCGGNGLFLYLKIAKTKKTFRYVPDYLLIGYLTKQGSVFQRSDLKPRAKAEIAQTNGSSRRGPKSNAYVKEGDIVGALAPEIGRNNIGRKMLEMLGWSSGEGLGALGNKGISTPVLATVKKSKTGLK